MRRLPGASGLRAAPRAAGAARRADWRIFRLMRASCLDALPCSAAERARAAAALLGRGTTSGADVIPALPAGPDHPRPSCAKNRSRAACSSLHAGGQRFGSSSHGMFVRRLTAGFAERRRTARPEIARFERQPREIRLRRRQRWPKPRAAAGRSLRFGQPDWHVPAPC